MNAHYKKVGVLMGGWSAEREISLASGEAVMQSLQRCKVNAVGLDISRENVMQLSQEQIDCAFIVLHGCGGEDGVIQALLTLLDIPFTGSGVTASALAMDKSLAKRVWQGSDVPTPRFAVVKERKDLERIAGDIGYPLALKPISGGSSIGVSRVDDESQLEEAYQSAIQNDNGVMIESWIEGDEYAVGFVGEQVLPPIRLETPRAFYDYEAKYHDEQNALSLSLWISG